MLLVGVAGGQRQVGQAVRPRVATRKLQEALHAEDPQEEGRPVAERRSAAPVELPLGETDGTSKFAHRGWLDGAKAGRRLQRDLVDAWRATVQSTNSLFQLRGSSLVIGPARHPLQQLTSGAITPQVLEANSPVAQLRGWNPQRRDPRLEAHADHVAPAAGGVWQRSCLWSRHPDRSVDPVHVDAFVGEQRAGVTDVSPPRAAELGGEVSGRRTLVEPLIDNEA